MLNIFLPYATALLTFIAVIWDRSNWSNIFVKLLFTFGAMLGVVLTLAQFGYITLAR